MNKSRVAILVLALALIGSNAWWAYRAVDAGVTAGYHEASFREHHQALAQAIAILPVAANPDATPAQVLEAAKQAARTSNTFEEDGFVWVGQLGLKFSGAGRLLEVKPSWSPF